MRTGRYRDVLIAATAVAALAIAASPVPTGAEACPAPVADHIPRHRRSISARARYLLLCEAFESTREAPVI
jgi:hypothetical protein